VIPETLAVAASPPPAVASGRLVRACSAAPGIECRLVWDVTHSGRAAELTQVYFAGPTSLALRIALIVLIALLVRVVVHRLIRRFTANVSRRAEVRPSRPHVTHVVLHERHQQRASAAGSILRNAASVIIFMIAFFMILGEVGLNLAPVLTSAGVLGVAVGFGAQKLVQDLLAGIFMMLEDQYGVGDTVKIGQVTGTVEAVSLRITRLRDVHGVAWHIRNGTIKQAGNESHGWACAVVDFPVPYSRDLSKVNEVIEKVAVAVWQEQQWRDVILDRPEVCGVQHVSLEEVVLRVTARTVPLRQWDVSRELRERLKDALDAAGDSIAG
jgi:small-conductance mechanosensitive channel